MIEVGQSALGYWAWTLISGDGRTLMYGEGWATRSEAWAAAWIARYRCWARSAEVDWRMGACF